MPVYSHSRLETYEKCPLQFKFRYVDRVKVEEEKIELFLGHRVHETLEKLYRDLSMTKKNSVEELLSFYDSSWEKDWLNSVVILNKELTADHYRDLGRKYIEDYYQSYYPFDQGKTLGLEQRIFIDLTPDGRYKIQGFIDRLVEKGKGVYEVHDYKTNRRLPAQEDLDSDRQLALYQLGLEKKWRDVKKVDLVWHFLHFDKEMRSFRTKEQLENLCRETIGLIVQIEEAKKENNFPAKESALCDWCSFRNICPQTKHFHLVENLPTNEYLKDSGVQLVNKYVELNNQLSLLEQEKEKLKEAIFAYAKDQKVEAIKGSNYQLRVKIEMRKELPYNTYHPQEWRRLEQEIKGMGKWMEVSELNRNALQRVIQSKSWEKSSLEVLEEFLAEKEYKRIYSSKLRDEDTV